VTRLRGAARSGESDDSPWLDVVKDVLGAMGWTAEPPTSRGQVRDRWESFQALADQAEEFATERGIEASIAAFVEELDRRATEQHAPSADGVTLATFHAAKGLEWDAVFCCGVQDGTVPIVYAEQGGARPDAVEEERRLLYVGVTRARRDLMVSWAAARNPGQAPRRQPSRFIVPMLPASQQPQQSRGRTKVARCRDCLQPLTTAAEKKRGRCAHHPVRYDEALFDRLKAWRLETAREAGEDGKPLPAYVVFTDATLELIAEHKPASMAALAKVNGVGPSKIERYGDAVLALVADGG
jgi:DNA helicase-2/ATP-dependent DNA helicase PcrA